MNKNDYDLYEQHIAGCPLFRGMSEDEIWNLLKDRSTRIVKYQSGMLIDSSALFVVLEGCIVIEKQASDGRFVTMGKAEPFAAINAATVFLKTAPMSRMMASADSILLRIEEDTLRNAVLCGGTFAFNMVEFLSDRISFLNHKITSFAGYSASGRLQMYLEENSVNAEVTLPMSLTDFAEFLGVGRASLYRTLDQMEADGSICRNGRHITLLGAAHRN